MKMVKYAQNELFSITDFSKQIASVVSSVEKHSLEKVGILKNNKLEVVVISTDEYERLKAYEEMIEFAEHTEIYNTVEQRKATPLSEYLSMDELAKELNIDLSKI